MNLKGCSCKECVEMCKTYACLPTPHQAQALIDAGYGGRLMLDTRPSISNPKLLIFTLMPAMAGFECSISPMQIGISPCTFLTEKNRCELHDLGLKPFEGRFCRHNTKRNHEQDLMRCLKRFWSSPLGRHVVDSWIVKYYKEPDDFPELMQRRGTLA